MVRNVGRRLGSIRTTILGGVFFLLPLVAVCTLLGKLYQFVVWATDLINPWIAAKSPGTMALILLGSLLVTLLICFLAGIAAQKAVGQFFSRKLEQQVLMLFPRYAIIKEQLAGHFGGDVINQKMKPVLVRYENHTRLAFEVDRGLEGMTAVYLPSSPDPWNGIVAFVNADQIQPVPLKFPEAMKVFETMGHDSIGHLFPKKTDQPETK